MQNYLDLIRELLARPENMVLDRTGVGTFTLWQRQLSFQLDYSFPLLASKFTSFKNVARELLWFISGSTNVGSLHPATIWDEWADSNGELGPIYGKQWRNFGGVDQLLGLEQAIRATPTSRRLLVSAWNPPEIPQMALPPCHAFFQCHCDGADGLDLAVYLRSSDVFLGLPYNIASYALLLHLLSHTTQRQARRLTLLLGDVHLYRNHVLAAEALLARPAVFREPQLVIRQTRASVVDFTLADFELVNYYPEPAIPVPVAV